jgi:hypothetical protein
MLDSPVRNDVLLIGVNLLLRYRERQKFYLAHKLEHLREDLFTEEMGEQFVLQSSDSLLWRESRVQDNQVFSVRERKQGAA